MLHSFYKIGSFSFILYFLFNYRYQDKTWKTSSEKISSYKFFNLLTQSNYQYGNFNKFI